MAVLSPESWSMAVLSPESGYGYSQPKKGVHGQKMLRTTGPPQKVDTAAATTPATAAGA